MVEKNLRIPDLLDIYGCLLTPRQRMLTEYYYCEDLSLGEIDENEGISRQGARDFIKKAEAKLIGYEQQLKIMENNKNTADLLENIRALCEIERDNALSAKILSLINDCKEG